MRSLPDEKFQYDVAFSRNLGWLADWEQQALAQKTVAIAGMGGVGGYHLLTLARFGVGGFHVADPDEFELANFNRQIGATLDTIGRPKVEVLAEMARKINPRLRCRAFREGVSAANIDAFLDGVDLFIDGLDFFVLDVRRLVFARCRELGIPAITAAPLGMGTAFLVFTPDGMSFEDYFRLEGLSVDRQYVNFLVGLAPRALHRTYMADWTRVDLAGRRGPSTVAGCELAAGVAATEAVKLLIRRGEVKAAPCYHHFDAFRGRWVSGRLPFGNGGPIQRLKLAVAYRAFAAFSERSSPAAAPAARHSDIEEILDAARWSPSGDNVQPWRFVVEGPDDLTVLLRDDSGDDVYDYRGGEPSLLSGGMLLESLRIAASGFGRDMSWRYEGKVNHLHRIAVRLPKASGVAPDPLRGWLTLRSVDRRPYRLSRLSEAEKRQLAAALGEGIAVRWHETLGERLRFARVNGRATRLRLSIPEAFRVHRRVIDWERERSPEGIPAGALGVRRSTRLLMRWALRSWRRARLLNLLGGGWGAAAEMDLVPGFCSGAFFTLRKTDLPQDPQARAADLLEVGTRLQRFWLTATKLGLALQPCMATLIFAHYGETNGPFTGDAAGRRKAAELAGAFRELAGGTPVEEQFFSGRVGRPHRRASTCRSVRRPLSSLMVLPNTERLAGPESDAKARPLVLCQD